VLLASVTFPRRYALKGGPKVVGRRTCTGELDLAVIAGPSIGARLAIIEYACNNKFHPWHQQSRYK
jgi:hypothetical protein